MQVTWRNVINYSLHVVCTAAKVIYDMTCFFTFIAPPSSVKGLSNSLTSSIAYIYLAHVETEKDTMVWKAAILHFGGIYRPLTSSSVSAAATAHNIKDVLSWQWNGRVHAPSNYDQNQPRYTSSPELTLAAPVSLLSANWYQTPCKTLNK